MRASVSQRLVSALRELGVRHVYGVPSGGWVDYLDALRATPGIDFVLTGHEGGAGFMAAVTGRLTGVPGVCFGTLGPGATNLSTGVGCALLDRCPMLALSDEAPASMRGRTTQMGIDHQALFAPLTKHTTRLDADSVERTIESAAALALAERPGPVHIGLPVGLSAEIASERPPTAPAAANPEPAPAAELGAIESALGGARRPLLAAGLSAVRSGAADRLEALATRLGAPVVLTPMAKGLLAHDHPCYAGVLFHALSDRVLATSREADLVVGIGYDPVEFNYESWLGPSQPLVSIDTVPADVDSARVRLRAEAVGEIGPALDRLTATAPAESSWDLAALARRRAQMFERLAAPANTFGPRAALALLREALPAEGILTCDVGAHTHLIGQQWPTPHPDRLLMTNGWSAMGFGIPAAVAAALCCPGTPVCAVIGDGGLLMSAGELATLARENLPVVIVVLSDHDLALIRIKQQRKGNPIYGTPVRKGGCIGSGHLFGVPLRTAASPEQFKTALAGAFGSHGPVIVEALIDSREYDDLVLR